MKPSISGPYSIFVLSVAHFRSLCMLVGHSESFSLFTYQFCLSCYHQYLVPMIRSMERIDNQDVFGLCNDRREVIKHTPG